MQIIFSYASGNWHGADSAALGCIPRNQDSESQLQLAVPILPHFFQPFFPTSSRLFLDRSSTPFDRNIETHVRHEHNALLVDCKHSSAPPPLHLCSSMYGTKGYARLLRRLQQTRSRTSRLHQHSHSIYLVLLLYGRHMHWQYTLPKSVGYLVRWVLHRRELGQWHKCGWKRRMSAVLWNKRRRHWIVRS
jgi:hypothetical protein